MPVQLTTADYKHPGWPALAPELNLDVHSGVGVGAIDPPHTLQKTDRPHNYRRFMSEVDADGIAPILGITSFGLTLASRDILFIPEVFVPRDLRGVGYGRTLMELIEDHARSEGKNQLLLQSLKSSLGFYTRLGFSIMPREDEKPFMIKDVN